MSFYGVNQEAYQNQTAVSGYGIDRTNSRNTSKTKAGEEVTYGRVNGRTIGEPKLSEKAAKYYEQLQKKYSNMEFILVSPDMKQQAEQNKGSLQSSKGLIVLIDSDKIEKMAEDENYRKKYEGIIRMGAVKMNEMKDSLGSSASAVRSFGMSIDDHGHSSYFAVLDRSLAAQRERIAEKRKENTQAKKEAAKKAAEKRAEKRKEAKKADEKTESTKEDVSSDTITVTADSWDELLREIQKIMPESTSLMTEAEQKVGQKFDSTI